MEIIHTIGIALDPSAAKSGGAEAAAAFVQVGQAAESMSSKARFSASALRPVGTAFESIATELSAIDFQDFVSGLKEMTSPLETLRRQLTSTSTEAKDLRVRHKTRRQTQNTSGLDS